MMSLSFKHVYNFIFMPEFFADLSILLLINPITNDRMMSCVTLYIITVNALSIIFFNFKS